MTTHLTGAQNEWLAARLELLKAEKELTRRSDELARQRQELPWVGIDKEYRFEINSGSASLTDLFQGRSQLLVYHFMFGPDFKAGCPACSAIADGFNGIVAHLENHVPFHIHPLQLNTQKYIFRPSAATSISNSTSRSPKNNSARATSNTTSGATIPL